MTNKIPLEQNAELLGDNLFLFCGETQHKWDGPQGKGS